MFSNMHKGMIMDLGVDKLQEGYYFSLTNGSIVTDEGVTTGNPTNVKGNKLQFTIPEVSNVVRFHLDDTTDLASVDITINGLVKSFTGTYTTNLEYFELLKVFILTNYPTLKLNISYNEDYLYIFSTFTIALTITTDSTSISIVDVFSSQTGLFPIGWCLIRDDIYLFTTNDKSTIPNSLGQIFKLTYNKLTLTNTIELIYQNYLNFSLEYPIANPGMIEGRYENSNLQKIYWTDNYNNPRVINVSDPNVFAIQPENLSINSSINFSKPILKEVLQTGGGLETGLYQIAYRLKNLNSGESAFSPLSDLIQLKEFSDHSGSILDSQGSDSGIVTSKALKFEISNIDPDYTRIEVVLIKKETLNSTPEITIVTDEVISGSTITVIITGKELNSIPITLFELNVPKVVFDTVGTLSSMKNYLLFGNIKTKSFDINYDARAYRYQNINVDPTLAGYSDPDDINPDDSPTENGYIYQNDGLTFGGSGPNISYKFVTSLINLDNKMPNDSNPLDAPYRDCNRNTTVTAINSYLNFESPYIASTLTGYLRDEIYRFAITFYDLYGNSSFAKWIADIRFPHMFMPFPAVPSTQQLTYAPASLIIDPSIGDEVGLLGYSMGIEFTVNIPANIRSQISGYSIVRVDRDDSNKTILGQGSLHQVYKSLAQTDAFLFPGDNANHIPEFGMDINGEFMHFNSPDFLFNSSPTDSGADSIDVLDVLEATRDYTIASTGVTELSVCKNYGYRSTLAPRFNALSNNPYTILETKEFENYHINKSPQVVNGITIYNKSTNDDSAGSKTLLIRGNFNNFADPSGDAFYFVDNLYNTKHIYLANYKRNLGSSQYGGNTNAQKANNIYISTGHYQPINTGTTNLQFINTVYGGDTYVTVFDNVTQFANRDANDSPSTPRMQGRLFPVETCVNTELRQFNPLYDDGTDVHKLVLNKEVLQTDLLGINLFEIFRYNPVYSNPNNSKIFISKPLDFISNEILDTRVYRSEVKINGELTDSWTQFKADNFIDIESKYGELKILITNNNELLFYQPDAFGVISLDNKTLIPDSTGEMISVGTGGVLDRFDYKSNGIGSSHKFSFSKSSTEISWFDIKNKLLYKYGNGITPLTGMNGYISKNTVDLFDNDNPYKNLGITSTYDFKYKQFIYTVLKETNSFTISYSDVINNFHSFYSFLPSYYINDRLNILSGLSEDDDIYIHDKGIRQQFYGTNYPMILNILINDNPDKEKIYDNLIVHSELYGSTNNSIDQTFNTLRCYNDYQNTSYVPLVRHKNLDRVKRDWKMTIGTDRVIDNTADIFNHSNLYSYPNRPKLSRRLKSNFVFAELTYNGTPADYKFIVQNINSIYRQNPN